MKKIPILITHTRIIRRFSVQTGTFQSSSQDSLISEFPLENPITKADFV